MVLPALSVTHPALAKIPTRIQLDPSCNCVRNTYMSPKGSSASMNLVYSVRIDRYKNHERHLNLYCYVSNISTDMLAFSFLGGDDV